ncbi:zinc finger protein 2 homolog [Bradysia coprophila]|uniref:zinc finger protein 2 homolog n=1 Tax=Bradysia coprophila TaxID=38358 RepID=UPI00187DC400|nr:zinc finger protein 2 homolog [Bradysia coprophila]
MERVFDINKICRVCLEEGILLSIYSNEYAISPLDMIVSCTNVKITDDDDELPSSICNNCMYRLEVAYQLKQQCENSDMRLRECLGLDVMDNSEKPEKNAVNSNISKDNYVKLVSIPNNDNSTQVKDEEIYAAMNAMCEIFGESNTEEAVMLQSHIEQDVIPITTVPSYIHQDDMDETLNLSQVDYTIAPSSEDVKVASSNESEKISEPTVSRPSKRKKQKSLVSRADLDKFLSEKKSKRKSGKAEQRKTKKLTDPTQCLICGKTFAYGYMESHVRTHSGERPFKCTCCNLKFSQPGNLALHMRVHSGERPYQCEKCSKLFTTSSNLKAHQRIHSDSRDFPCTQCDRAFKSASELNSHAGTHTGEKKHKCLECGKTFYKTSYLNVHFRTVHVGEKRHHCTECGKKFSNSSNLTCHYRIHSGEKPFVCQICGTRFNQSSALVRHSKQHNTTISNKTPSTNIEPPRAEPPTSNKPLPIDSDIGYHDSSIDCQSIDPFSTYIKVPDSSNLW